MSLPVKKSSAAFPQSVTSFRIVSFLSLIGFKEELNIFILDKKLAHPVRGAAHVSISSGHLDRVFSKSESCLNDTSTATHSKAISRRTGLDWILLLKEASPPRAPCGANDTKLLKTQIWPYQMWLLFSQCMDFRPKLVEGYFCAQ